MATKANQPPPSIIENVFIPVVQETEAIYGSVNRDQARRLLFALHPTVREKYGTTFPIAKSRLLTAMNIPECERSRYHSLATKYYKRVAGKKRPRKAKAQVSLYSDILSLCEQESDKLAIERNEHIINADGKDMSFYDGGCND